jgi:hypothetical protein
MYRILFLVVCVIVITILSMLLTKQNNRDIVPDTYTTFLGSNYSIYIAGVLTKAHVQEAEAVIGTIKGVQIGTAVTNIGSGDSTTDTAPFYGKTALKTLTFKGFNANNERFIGRYCFQGCTGLTSVVLANSIDSIESYAFKGCTSLTTIIFGNSLQQIKTEAFYGCTSLTTLTFPVSFNRATQRAFVNTTLSSVIFTGSGIVKIFSCNAIQNENNPFSSPQSLVDACAGVDTIEIPANGITYT